MANTYTLISSNTLSSSAASVTFSSIPSTYTDLVLRVSARSTRAATSNNMNYRLNAATTNYSYTYIYGSGSSAASARGTGDTYQYLATMGSANSTTNTITSSELYIPSYTASINKLSSRVSAFENNSSTTWEIDAGADLYSSTSAITSITLYSGEGNFSFDVGSSFYLYGIKNSQEK